MPKPKANKTIELLAAVEKVLRQAGRPLHSTEIAQEIGTSRSFTKFGAKPSNEVYSTLYGDIDANGTNSRFRKSGPAEFTLASTTNSGVAVQPQESVASGAEGITSHAAGFIQAFGMYWRRDLVEWKSQAKLLGIQQRGATSVDFGPQKGVYLLHDGRAVVYVRADDRPDDGPTPLPAHL